MTESDSDTMRERVEALERENQRLRARTDRIFGPDDPTFDPQAFQRVLSRYSMLMTIPFCLLLPLGWLLSMGGMASIPRIPIGPTVLIDVGGAQSGWPGVGLGVIAFGGLAIGGLAIGGGAIGIVAVGGGALGLVAFGGGAVGIIAFGGGAFGVVAIGGGAAGYYALGGHGAGRYVFSLKRRDKEAVDFFCRYLPGLRKCLTGPMPVVPVDTSGFTRPPA